jgi:hypothetical protein
MEHRRLTHLKGDDLLSICSDISLLIIINKINRMNSEEAKTLGAGLGTSALNSTP